MGEKEKEEREERGRTMKEDKERKERRKQYTRHSPIIIWQVRQATHTILSIASVGAPIHPIPVHPHGAIAAVCWSRVCGVRVHGSGSGWQWWESWSHATPTSIPRYHVWRGGDESESNYLLERWWHLPNNSVPCRFFSFVRYHQVLSTYGLYIFCNTTCSCSSRYVYIFVVITLQSFWRLQVVNEATWIKNQVGLSKRKDTFFFFHAQRGLTKGNNNSVNKKSPLITKPTPLILLFHTEIQRQTKPQKFHHKEDTDGLIIFIYLTLIYLLIYFKAYVNTQSHSS